MVNFAGVPHNFNFQAKPTAPMNDMQPPAPNSPIGVSRSVPGAAAQIPGDPNTVGADGSPAKGASPLDKFTSIFDTTPKVGPDGKPITAPAPAPTILDAGADVYMKAAEKLDFTSFITPEQRAAMAKGGEAGTNAFLEALNAVGRSIYANAGATASSVTKRGLEIAAPASEARVQQAMTLAGATATIEAKNSALAHPAYKPMVQSVQSQIIQAQPTITVQELAQLTLDYFSSLAATPAPFPQNEERSFFDGL